RARQLDVSRYGRQRWQDGGKNGKVRGTVATDSGTIWHVQGAIARGGWARTTGFHTASRWVVVVRWRPGMNAGGNPAARADVAMTTTQDEPVSLLYAVVQVHAARGGATY